MAGVIVMLGDDGYDWHKNGRNVTKDNKYATHYYRVSATSFISSKVIRDPECESSQVSVCG